MFIVKCLSLHVHIFKKTLEIINPFLVEQEAKTLNRKVNRQGAKRKKMQMGAKISQMKCTSTRELTNTK